MLQTFLLDKAFTERLMAHPSEWETNSQSVLIKFLESHTQKRLSKENLRDLVQACLFERNSNISRFQNADGLNKEICQFVIRTLSQSTSVEVALSSITRNIDRVQPSNPFSYRTATLGNLTGAGRDASAENMDHSM